MCRARYCGSSCTGHSWVSEERGLREAWRDARGLRTEGRL